jgi:hypothetical protein
VSISTTGCRAVSGRWGRVGRRRQRARRGSPAIPVDIKTRAPGSGGSPFFILPFRGTFPAPPKPRVGRPLSADHRAKLGAALRGRPLSPERRAKIAAALGRPETRARLAAAHRGVPKSGPHRAAIGAALEASPSAAARAARLRGIPRPAATRARIGAALRRPGTVP